MTEATTLWARRQPVLAPADGPQATSPRAATSVGPARANVHAEFFGPPPAPDARLSALDWPGLGVDLSYVVFITGRCGSTWLTHLLHDSGLCGNPSEFFNAGALAGHGPTARTLDFRTYFRGLVSRHKAGRRFGMQVDAWRFLQLLPYLDFPAVFPAERSVHFWMTREDIVAQAYSFAKAKVSGRWHVYRDDKPAEAAPAAVTDADIWREVIFILSQEIAMEDWFAEAGIQPHRLTYEQIVADKFMLLARVMGLLGCDAESVLAHLATVDDRTGRMPYDDRHAVLVRFTERFRPLVERILAKRTAVDVVGLQRDLRDMAGIAA